MFNKEEGKDADKSKPAGDAAGRSRGGCAMRRAATRAGRAAGPGAGVAPAASATQPAAPQAKPKEDADRRRCVDPRGAASKDKERKDREKKEKEKERNEKRDREKSAYPKCFRGLVSSRLFSVIVSTPSSSFALTVFSSTVGGSVKLRRNRL